MVDTDDWKENIVYAIQYFTVKANHCSFADLVIVGDSIMGWYYQITWAN